MHLKDLSLLNFKNYISAEIRFDEKVNCLVGMNGSGKTNLLDAIYYLAFSKSFFNPSDVQNIYPEEAFFSLQGSFENDGGERHSIHCSLKKGHKKVLKYNGKAYERYADHIGLIPLVMISPIDILLIIEGSESRRRWMDSIISQFDKQYLDKLIKYNKALSQRNSQLKQMSPTSPYQHLEIWDEQLVAYGSYLHGKRAEVMEMITSHFNEYYQRISAGGEKVDIDYTSQLDGEERFADQLKDSFGKDIRLQFTSRGIHKDDLDFRIDGRTVKKYASQGQQKTALMALRLAQARLIADEKGSRPLMLLDDIYDKLDAERMARFLDILKSPDFGQLFITDTNREHMESLLGINGMGGKFFHVSGGNVESAVGEKISVQ